MKKKISFLMVVCIIISFFSGCSGGKSYEQMIVGEWYSEYVGSYNETFTWHFSFFEDGDYEELPSSKSGTWNIVNQNDTYQLKLADVWHEFDVYEIVYLDEETLILSGKRGKKTFKRTEEEYSTYKQIEEYKLKNGDNGKSDDEIRKEIEKINELSQKADILDSYASKLDATCKKLYAGVTAGSIHNSSPADELGNLDVSKLPNATDTTKSKRDAANALTIKDAIEYAGLSKIAAQNANNYAFSTKNGTIIYIHSETSGTIAPASSSQQRISYSEADYQTLNDNFSTLLGTVYGAL